MKTNEEMMNIFNDADKWEKFKYDMLQIDIDENYKKAEILFENTKNYYSAIINEFNHTSGVFILLPELYSIYLSLRLIIDFINRFPSFISLQPLNDSIGYIYYYKPIVVDNNIHLNIEKQTVVSRIKNLVYKFVSKTEFDDLVKTKSVEYINDVIYENYLSVTSNIIIKDIINRISTSCYVNDNLCHIIPRNIENLNVLVKTCLTNLSNTIYKNTQMMPDYIICSHKNKELVKDFCDNIYITELISDNEILIGKFNDINSFVYAPYILSFITFRIFNVDNDDGIKIDNKDWQSITQYGSFGKIVLN